MPPRLLGLAGVLAAVLAAATACGSATVQNATPATTAGAATSSAAATTPATQGEYLALGDSVSFGYREPTTTPAPDYTDAASFVGYPEIVGADLHLQVANASCPGETSASLVSAGGASFGCESQPGGKGPGYRTAYPLHVSYSGTQLAYAVAFLQAHPDTKLVSLLIGANDGFLCQATTADKCVSEFTTLLATVQRNVATILSALRTQGGYRGRIVLLDYYSTDYSSALTTGLSQGLDGAIEAGGKPYDVTVADGLGAFKAAASAAGGKTCAAGLLTKLSTGGCGVHPSASGQQALATAVEGVVAG